MRGRKFRLNVRPKDRSRRRRRSLIAAGVCCAVAAFCFAGPRFWRWAEEYNRTKLKLLLVTGVGVTGINEPVRSRVLGAADIGKGDLWTPAKAARLSVKLEKEFPFFARVDVSRRLFTGGVEIEVSLRTPVAELNRGGKNKEYLDAGGEAFSAPSGLYEGRYVSVTAEVPENALKAESLSGLSEVIAEIQNSTAALPSGLAAITMSSSAEGWKLVLNDGSEVAWGAFEFTREKMARLLQVFEDAKTRMPGPVRVDLSFFRDGRILLRPNPAGPKQVTRLQVTSDR